MDSAKLEQETNDDNRVVVKERIEDIRKYIDLLSDLLRANLKTSKTSKSETNQEARPSDGLHPWSVLVANREGTRTSGFITNVGMNMVAITVKHHFLRPDLDLDLRDKKIKSQVEAQLLSEVKVTSTNGSPYTVSRVEVLAIDALFLFLSGPAPYVQLAEEKPMFCSLVGATMVDHSAKPLLVGIEGRCVREWESGWILDGFLSEPGVPGCGLTLRGNNKMAYGMVVGVVTINQSFGRGSLAKGSYTARQLGHFVDASSELHKSSTFTLFIGSDVLAQELRNAMKKKEAMEL